MEIEMEIRFSRKDLEEMCLERCKGMEPAGGNFEAQATYSYGMPEVKVTFVRDPEPAPTLKPEPIIPSTDRMLDAPDDQIF